MERHFGDRFLFNDCSHFATTLRQPRRSGRNCDLLGRRSDAEMHILDHGLSNEELILGRLDVWNP